MFQAFLNRIDYRNYLNLLLRRYKSSLSLSSEPVTALAEAVADIAPAVAVDIAAATAVEHSVDFADIRQGYLSLYSYLLPFP